METLSNQNGWRWLVVPDQWERIRMIVCDIDDTLYRHPEYSVNGTQGEISGVAEILGAQTGEQISYETMRTRILTLRQELSTSLGRPAGMTETVRSFGIIREQWDELRCRVWQPEEWLTRDEEVCGTLYSLSQKYRLVFGTNSPVAVGRRVLATLGVDKAVPDASVFGSDTLGVSKPHSDFFMRITERLGFAPRHCIAIGDRTEMDGTPALAAGYAGAVIISGGRDAFIAAAEQLFTRQKMEICHEP